MRVVSRVKKPNSKGKHNRMRRGVKRGNGIEAVPSSGGQPGMRGDPLIPNSHPMRDPSNKSRALQRRNGRVSVGPERCTPSLVGNGKRERHTPVGQAHPPKPVTNLNSPIRGPNLSENLEGMQGPARLALRRPKVGLKPPPIPPISIPIPINSSEYGLNVPTPNHNLKPPPVKQPAMHSHEGGSRLNINSHASNPVPSHPNGLERFGRPATQPPRRRPHVRPAEWQNPAPRLGVFGAP